MSLRKLTIYPVVSKALASFLTEEDVKEIVNNWVNWVESDPQYVEEFLPKLLRSELHSVKGRWKEKKVEYVLLARLLGKDLEVRLGLLEEKDRLLDDMPGPEILDGQHRSGKL